MIAIKNIKILILIVLITGTLFTGCLSPAEKDLKAQNKVMELKIRNWDAKQRLNNASQNYSSEYDEFKKESENKIYDYEERISQYKIRLTNENLIDKNILENKLTELEQKNNELKKRLIDYKVDGQNNWVPFKSKFNHDMEELGKAYRNLASENTL
jgi:hypothetical protein